MFPGAWLWRETRLGSEGLLLAGRGAGNWRLRREVEVALAALAAVVAAGVLARGTGLPVGTAMALAAIAMAGAALAFLKSDERRLGSANAVTVLRLGLAASLLGQLVAPAGAEPGWPVVALATLAFLLDGVDGWLARRRAVASTFGAKFDTEADAVLTIVLAVLLIGMGRVGPWLLAPALMRPAFVLAARHWQWLAAPLPPSFRRKLVCVLTIILLIFAASPAAGAASAALAALAATMIVIGSFAIDIAWLAHRRHATST